MAGLRRRIRAEGWAQDVSDADDEMHSSFIHRLGNNNKLWVAALIVLVFVAGMLLMQAKEKGSQKNEELFSPPARLAFGSYDDKPHMDFTTEFLRKNPRVVDAHFAEGKFVIVVPGDVGPDDIEHVSSIAAQRNLAKFKNRIVVEVYQRSVATRSDTLVATTKWEVGRYGFVVKLLKHAK